MPSAVEPPRWYKFRVLGHLKQGVLTVRPVPPPSPPGYLLLFDLFIDEIPIDLVPPELRMPNTEFWGLVEVSQSVSSVRASIAPADAPHYEPTTFGRGQ
jgi:hypothetical protein